MTKSNPDSLARSLGKSIEIEIKGRKFKVSPLTLGDIASIETAIRSDQIKSFLDAAQGIPPSEKISVLNFLASSPVSMEDGNKIFVTRQMLLCSLKKEQPELTMEELDSLISLDNIDELDAIVTAISSIGGGEEDINPQMPEAPNSDTTTP